MQFGIVGLPFSGKSTLFQAVTKTHLASAPAGRGDSHLGVITVPDVRLDQCSALFSPKRTVHATIELVDVPGLKKGGSGTAQFTTGFLSDVKTNDALVEVVRLFKSDMMPHPEGSIDPLRDGLRSRPSSSSSTWPCSNRGSGKFISRSVARTTTR